LTQYNKIDRKAELSTTYWNEIFDEI